MSNPFDDDSDFDRNRHAYGGGGGDAEDEDDALNFYQRQIETTLRSTLDSTTRSLRMLEDSEAVGVGTAEDLLVQGEKLRKVERQLDEMNQTTTQTQRHLNNIKSIFGGIKNRFSRSATTAGASGSDSTPKQGLEKEVDRLKSDTSGFYGSGKEVSSPSTASISSLKDTRWGVMDQEIDENLDMMSANLSRLRNLGQALGDEVDQQNELISRITVKADKVDTVVRDQDKQMKRIMGYKK